MSAKCLASFLFLAVPGFSADPAGLRDFHQVNENVFRGRQPQPEGYKTLVQMGVKTVIDLRGGWIHEPHERKLVEAAGLNYVEERFSGIFAPKDAQVAKLLAVMLDPAATPVFVHCRRGADRVGELIACYRMVHDHWTNVQAMAEASDIGMSRLEPLMRRYVRNFNPARLNLPAAAVPGEVRLPLPPLLDPLFGQ